MTIRFFIHSIAKRAKVVALLDSGATENFMNLSYAKWLKLPIKQLPNPHKLFNIDGTENQSGDLRYYTILNVRTSTTTVPLQPWRTQSHPWLPMVHSRPTQNRLETWLDQPHSPSCHF